MADKLNFQIFNSKSNLKKVIIAAGILVILIVIVAVYSFLTAEKKEVIEEVVSRETILEKIKPGKEGEIGEGKTLEEVNPETVTMPVRPPGAQTPPIISDTKGKIVSIGKNSLTILGSGENFEDQKARELIVKFTDQTITFEKGQKVKYVGLEGLNHLEIGQEILISSSENIRGKTEFTADYINKI